MSAKRTLALTALMAALFAAAPSQALVSDRLKKLELEVVPEGVFGNQVIVPHDGQDRQPISGEEAKIRYLLSIEVETKRKKYEIDHVMAGVAFAYDQQGKLGGGLITWDGTQRATLYPGNPTHKLSMTNERYEYAVVGQRAANACRFLYRNLAAQGMTHDEILAEDRTTSMPQEIGIAVRVRQSGDSFGEVHKRIKGSIHISHGYWQFKKVWSSVQVKCLRKPMTSEIGKAPLGPSTDDLTLGFAVQKIEIAITPREQAGVCPRQKTLKIDVFATAAGTAKVRALTSGWESPVIRVPVVHHPASGGFVGSKLVTVTVGQAVQSGPATQASSSGGGMQLDLDTQDHVHQGTYWVRASNGVKSNHAAYKVTCTPPPFEPGITANGGGTRPPILPGGKPRLTVKAIKPRAAVGAAPARRAAKIAATASGTAKADLVIAAARLRPGKTGGLSVQVRNQGAATAGPSSLKLLYTFRGARIAVQASVPPIGPGQTRPVTVGIGAPLAKAEKISLLVDAGNRVPESNDRNNGRRVR